MREPSKILGLCALLLITSCNALSSADDAAALDSGVADADSSDSTALDAFVDAGGSLDASIAEVGIVDATLGGCLGFEDCHDPARSLCAQVAPEGGASTQCGADASVACVPAQRGCVCVVGPPDPGSTRAPGVTGLFCFD